MPTIESLEQELAITYKNIQHQQEWRDNLSYELKRTKRGLWLARAERAIAEQTIHEFSRYREKHPYGFWWNKSFNEWVKMWIFVERKCRAYAHKFKA